MPTPRASTHRPRDSRQYTPKERPKQKSWLVPFVQRAAQLFGCTLCREHDPACLSFYIVTATDIKALRVRHCQTVDQLKEELRQGTVLCRNCHKRVTEPRHVGHSWLRQYKARRGCADCGKTHATVLEFHHEGKKHFDISKHRCSLPRAVVERELEKTIVLCANCHGKRHGRA